MQAPRSGRAFGPDRYPELRQRADPGCGAWRLWVRPGESEGREVGVRGLAGVGAAGAIGGRGLGPGCGAYWGGRGRGAADPAGGGELVRRVPLPRWAPPATAQGPVCGGLQPAPDLPSGTVRTSGPPCSGRTDDPEPCLTRVKNVVTPLCRFSASLHPHSPPSFFGSYSISDRLCGTFSL